MSVSVHGAGRKKPTIFTVAERANVSISTVSRVINGGRTSEEIRQRVHRAIGELGYSPSAAARNLVIQRTDCIGLAVNSTQSPWFSQLLLGIEEALSRSRKSVLLASMMLHGRYDARTVAAWIRERRVDGLILVRCAERDRPLYESAKQRGVPTVLIAPDLTVDDTYTVRGDNIRAGRLVASHLAELGHRHVCFAGGPRESRDTRERLQGLRQHLVLDEPDIYFGRGYGREAGIEYARHFLALPRASRPSAVVLGNDTMALAFMQTLQRSGLRVPDDVSVIGFDGTPDGEQCWPGLTTVVQPSQRMARDACRALLQRVSGEVAGGGSQEYAVELLVRESTGPMVAPHGG